VGNSVNELLGNNGGVDTEAAGALGPFLGEVAERLVTSPVVHVDETPDQVRTGTWWFHVASTDLYTLLFASATRGKAAPDQAGVLGRFAGVMVHDRLAMYFRYKAATHLICGAHLPRDLAAAGGRWNQGWAGEMSRLLTEANKACHAARDEGRTSLHPEQLAAFLSSYDALVEEGLAANPTPENRERNYLEKKSYNVAVALRDRRAEATRFATDMSLPFDNNGGERSLRMAKLTRRSAADSRPTTLPGTSQRSAPTSAQLASMASAVSTSSVGLFRGDVWMPPATT